MTNPLLRQSTLPHGALPFDQIKPEHFLPALEARLVDARERVEAIRSNTEAPNFNNTIRALEASTAAVYDVATTYHNLRAADGDSTMQGLAKDIMPKVVELQSDIQLDTTLYERVQAVAKLGEQLSDEQATLLDKTLKAFERNGANLDPEQKAKLREIDEQLSTLGPKFSENNLKATNSFELVISDEADLAGLPDSLRDAAAATGNERGHAGKWVFTLHFPSAFPFLKYCDSEDLRKQMYLAMSSRAVSGDNSNIEVVKEIARLRHARAKLLGFATFAEFQLEERMAETPAKVQTFLDDLHQATLPAAKKELAALSEFKQQATGDGTVQQWDFHYWSNKLQEATYELDQEALRPYFRLEAVQDGAFEHATKLFGLHFRKRDDLPVYHDDVQIYEVSLENGDYRGLLYLDMFPRDTKSSGAWCTRFIPQWRDDQGNHRPHASIVCNFTKPSGHRPSLLTFQEVTTLFHEFGHALHNLLSDCEFRSLSCTSVYRDFVELPSQVMENWLLEKESLELFAKHYQSGETLPQTFIDKIKASQNFNAGLLMLRQLRFGLLDMAWYGQDPSQVDDVLAYERQHTKKADLFPDVPGTCTSCAFEHIFAGGYAAGYYSYKWAEVLDADAFELFKERGIFDRATAASFAEHVLAKGGSEHPMTLYKRFRGREPDPKALLRRYELA